MIEVPSLYALTYFILILGSGTAGVWLHYWIDRHFKNKISKTNKFDEMGKFQLLLRILPFGFIVFAFSMMLINATAIIVTPSEFITHIFRYFGIVIFFEAFFTLELAVLWSMLRETVLKD